MVKNFIVLILMLFPLFIQGQSKEIDISLLEDCHDLVRLQLQRFLTKNREFTEVLEDE